LVVGLVIAFDLEHVQLAELADLDDGEAWSLAVGEF